MQLSMASTPFVEKRFWKQLGLAVVVHKAAWLNTAESERRGGAGDRKVKACPSGSMMGRSTNRSRSKNRCLVRQSFALSCGLDCSGRARS